MKKRKERCDGRETREAILAAAEKEFAAKGYGLGSMRAICKNAHANSALANRYFGSKENLYRTVAERLFGDLGAPMANLKAKVRDAKTWRAAVEEWVDDFLFMTIPTARAQKLCAGLFRQEVVNPTRFHEEFQRRFGKPVYNSLSDLLAMAVKDEKELKLWCSYVWAQVTVYALADRSWHGNFRCGGADDESWRDEVRRFVCRVIFRSLRYAGA
ncbi:MAG: TetR/AcrR family transcriptional regulator [Kiritimatiellae bacterium]|nr:TetR/AcrR family transcriptional regulator [Kiritimatiellia bacterium]